jgi:outer membrane immunogenic protein
MREIIHFRPVRESISHSFDRLFMRRAAACLVAIAMPLAFVSTTALAADMPIKAAPVPAYQWSGCYAGLNVGGGATGSNFSTAVDPGTYLVGADPATVAATGSGSHGSDGLLAGGQVGCNLQSGLVVFGLEGDFDYFHSNPFFENPTQTLSDGVTAFNIKQSLSTDYLATVRPRIGIAADRNLAYLTAGIAFTRAGYTETYLDQAVPPAFGTATGSKSLVGWVAGAGWEYAFIDRWTFKAEYLYASFSKIDGLGAIADPGVGANVLHGSGDLTVQMLRAGVNYRF